MKHLANRLCLLMCLTLAGGLVDDVCAQVAHKQRQRRIIYNDDGDDIMSAETPSKLLQARLQHVVGTQVDSVFYCAGGTTVFGFDSHVAETMDRLIPQDTANPIARQYRDGVCALRETGLDSLGLVTDFCHRNGLEVFFSLRMNDMHDAFYDWAVSQWKRTHKEYLFGEVADWNRYDTANPRAWWSGLDYACPEVREYIFRILEDVCQRYDIDGIELDWFRKPVLFRPTLELRPVEAQHLAMIGNFVRRVRRMTQGVARERGRPLLVACRVPMSIERSQAIGLDVPTWLEEDLVDILVTGGGYAPMAMAPQVREMSNLGHSYGVPVYACISTSGMSGEHSVVEAWRGAAMNVWQAGADGVYTFNFWPRAPEAWDRLGEIGSPETLKGLDKIYGVDYIEPDKFLGCYRPGLVVPGRLPIEMWAGTWAQVHLPVGEEITANAPTGKAALPRLRLRLSGMTPDDVINLRLNGAFLRTTVASLSDDRATIWAEPDPDLVWEGDNLVEMKLIGERSQTEPVILDRLDLIVRYR